ncbi:MAG: hypothetical protein ABI361_00710 [Nitrososphaera sp.]|jgi:ribosomal protein S27AE
MLFGKKKEDPPRVYTEETCGKCGEKIRRSFQEGDFVFRKLDAECSKCSSTELMITGIYGEYPARHDDY